MSSFKPLFGEGFLNLPPEKFGARSTSVGDVPKGASRTPKSRISPRRLALQTLAPLVLSAGMFALSQPQPLDSSPAWSARQSGEFTALSPDRAGVAGIKPGYDELFEALEEVDRSGLSDEAAILAIQVIETFHDEAPEAPCLAVATDDGGLTLEFESEEAGRNVLYAIPEHGRQQFVAVQTLDGPCKAGKITRSRAHKKLAHWVIGKINSTTINGITYA